MIDRRIWRQDLAWAGFIILLAMLSGFAHQWKLVRLSWHRQLPVYLEIEREKRVQQDMPGIKTLNLGQAYDIFQEKKALFVDARTPEEFGEIHIPGAVNLPLERLKENGARALPDIPRDRKMVVYCGMLSCHAAAKVAEKLVSLGFTQVSVFMGGFRAWDEAGYPADTSR
jgi:rhodanese-related sulfurtransferase